MKINEPKTKVNNANSNPEINQNLENKNLETAKPFWADSYCVSQWTKPESEILIWKKSSLEESLENLAKISTFLGVENLWQKLYLELSLEKLAKSLKNLEIEKDKQNLGEKLEKNSELISENYVYLVDLNVQKILVQNKNGIQNLLGLEMKNSSESLTKNSAKENQDLAILAKEISSQISSKINSQTKLEATEETKKIEINPSKFLKICSFTKKSQSENFGKNLETEKDGVQKLQQKIVNIYFCPIDSIDLENSLNLESKQNLGKKNEIHNFDKKNENDNNKENNFLEFVDLSEFIKKNSFVNLAIWQNFCQENNLEKSEISLKEIHQSTLLSFWRTGDLELWADLAGTFWEREIKNWLIENNYKTGDFLWPLRVTLSGQKQSPSPFEILACLDLLETKKRIETCLVS